MYQEVQAEAHKPDFAQVQKMVENAIGYRKKNKRKRGIFVPYRVPNKFK